MPIFKSISSLNFGLNQSKSLTNILSNPTGNNLIQSKNQSCDGDPTLDEYAEGVFDAINGTISVFNSKFPNS
ncbi:hypothetical protein CYY_005753 [Polysphondylium violaceum]|uniref:Uncharacterized protein n=1 Tax=Polysphondylium violaceum TaxID=133409 RepID=A0A8J4URY8_9MYCE|nr:hypothetical protein CYY_005753 [Polysphondylium violaceum]